ncbi:uncharacterized protein LOC117215737 [Bombus bifarius]|uniref:Uncharacterized protein LOC117215737 n=1 Tax=Bombus bifarius TaxID=103933 RepID=A0A6P8NAF0_9HYME|nr:uncharacterized protein LOC117215737 [Bombus bifarius]
MLKGYMITVFLIAVTYSSFPYTNERKYICDTDGCKILTNNLNNNISSIRYCTSEDISTDVNFSIIENKNEASESPAIIQINLKPPKSICKYVLTLLTNASTSEEKCVNYKFHNSYGSETHTRSTIWFVSDKQYQNTIGIFVPYIFTACYSVQFSFDKDVKMLKHNKFIKTKYKRTEIMTPIFECTYDYNIDKKMGLLEVLLYKPMVTAGVIRLGKLWYDSSGNESCPFNKKEFPNAVWSFNVLDSYLGDKNYNFNTTLLTNEIYNRNLTFQTEISQKVNYCVSIFLYRDIRCQEYTLWEPPDICSWYQSCQDITISTFGVPTKINSDTTSYSYLPITIITLTIFTIIGIMYLIYIIHTYSMQGKSFQRNIFNGNVLKTNETKYKKKEKFEDANVKNTDIILLYPKGSESFMALMADFRGLLSHVCRCVVHDWYDGMQWNYVAEVGAFDWFAEMLHKECRVVWVDTPIMRALITQRFNNSLSVKNLEQYSFINIGDFRDAVFPTVFNLSKRNIGKSTLQEPKHFIVRLKEFDNFENDNDPFVDLSPHMRYFIPQDLNLLCSDLSAVDLNIIVPFTGQEDLIKQHLHYVKLDFYK